MGNEPSLIGRIAVESSANLIVQPAIRHLVKGERCHVKSAFIAGAVLITEKEVDGHARRKLRRVSKASVSRIEGGGENIRRSIQHAQVEAVAGVFQSLLLQLLTDLLRVVYDVIPLRLIDLRHRFQDPAESRAA